MPNPISIGIDLGTTFSAVAYIKDDGQPGIIVNQAQNNSVNLPSVVYYEDETSIVVGEAALNEAELYPDKTIRFAKRYMGENFDAHRPTGVPQDETPVKFQAKVLSAIKKYVEDHEDGYEIRNAVITVPAYFDFNKKNLTRDAAIIAGIDVLGIISEPMAAAIYYCANQAVENQKFLVYDLGGGTFDSVIIEYRVVDGRTEIITLASDGNHQLGGYDWDRRLESHLFEEAKKQNPDIPSLISELESDDRQMLFKRATETKIALGKSDNKKASFKIEGIPFNVMVTRSELEEITEDLLRETGNKVDSVLRQANLTEDEIDLVLLVGGSSFMPMVQNYVREKFGLDKVKLNNPNLAVAYGAAIYAHNMDSFLEQEHTSSTVPAPPPRQTSSTDWDIDDDVTADTNTPSVPRGDIEANRMRVVEQASHSVGVRVVIAGKTYVNNLIFKGDHFSADEPLVVSEEGFTCMSDGAFSAAFYENVRSARFTKSSDDFDSLDDYLEANKDALVSVTQNPNAQTEEEAFIPLNSGDQLTYLGVLHFEDDRINAGDPIKVTLIANQDGIFAEVEHTPTGKADKLEFVNSDRMTAAERESAQEEQNRIVISLD